MPEMPGPLAQLVNLKQLELTSIMFNVLKYSDLKWLVILLNACPVLEKLTWRVSESANLFMHLLLILICMHLLFPLLSISIQYICIFLLLKNSNMLD